MEPAAKKPRLLVLDQIDQAEREQRERREKRAREKEKEKEKEREKEKGKGKGKEAKDSNSKPPPQLPKLDGFSIPWSTRQKCFEKLVAQYSRIYSKQEDFEPVVEAMKKEEEIVKTCFDRSIYLNLMANLLRGLEKQKVFDLEEEREKQWRLDQALPKGITLTMLEQLCHPPNILAQNGYPLLLDFEELSVKSELSMTQQCARCGKSYHLEREGISNPLFKEMCTHHPGRAIRESDANPQKVYSCCNKTLEAPGCRTGPHVFEIRSFQELHGLSNVEFCSTRDPFDEQGPDSRKIMGLDCEMSYTLMGMELTRLSLVDANGKVLLDEFVKPTTQVVDFNTQFSGVTEEKLAQATLTFAEAQALFLRLVNSKTILVGHSLESDLKAMRIFHSRVIDTSILFPGASDKYKNSLKNLARRLLKKFVQAGTQGHDSVEDAQAALELVFLKAREIEETKGMTKTQRG